MRESRLPSMPPPNDAEGPRAGERFDPKLFSIVLGVHILAVGAAFHVSAQAVAVFVVLHVGFALFGVALGLHRLFAHRSFTPRRRLIYDALAICATLCFQGGPIQWAAVHRAHHRCTEREGDAHSAVRGFWWSHIGWLFYRNANGFSFLRNRRSVADLLRDPFLAWIDRAALTMNVSVLALSFGAALLLDRLDLFFWAMPLRLVSVWHATWLINSVGHGVRPFETSIGREDNRYTNSKVVSVLLAGEGYHAFHHAHPGAATYEPVVGSLDIAGWVLRAGESAGLWTIRERSRSLSVEGHD